MNIQTILKQIEENGLETVNDDILDNLLRICEDSYYNSDISLISDEMYDIIKRYRSSNIVGSGVHLGKVKLPYPMKSLDQIYEDSDISKWISKNPDDLSIVSEKLDGNSVEIVYQNYQLKSAYTRGDGYEGKLITNHILHCNVPKNVLVDNLTIRAEAIIKKEHEEIILKRYKNLRNAVAGMFNSIESSDLLKYIDIVAYQVMNIEEYDFNNRSKELNFLFDMEFKIPLFASITNDLANKSVLESVVERFNTESDYEIDGIVLDYFISDFNQYESSGNPKHSRKFKVNSEDDSKETEVTKIVWNVSKDGYLKPTVYFNPVELFGATIEKATGFNAKFIFDNRIEKGTIVKIQRSGMVIPYISSIVSSPYSEEDFLILIDRELSKFGDYQWNDTEVDLVVQNSDNAEIEQLIHFFSTIDAPMLKEGNVFKMFEHNFETVESIINASEDDIRFSIGSDIIGKIIYDGIIQKLSNIPLELLMGASPMFGRGIGVKKISKLLEKLEYSELFDYNKILTVKGFQEKTAKKIVEGMGDFQEFFDKIKHKVNLKENKRKTGKFENMNVVFTGFRDKNLEQMVIDNGGKIASSVSKNVTHVVTNDVNSNSGKIKKAKEMGIVILGKEEFWEGLK